MKYFNKIIFSAIFAKRHSLRLSEEQERALAETQEVRKRKELSNELALSRHIADHVISASSPTHDSFADMQMQRERRQSSRY